MSKQTVEMNKLLRKVHDSVYNLQHYIQDTDKNTRRSRALLFKTYQALEMLDYELDPRVDKKEKVSNTSRAV